MAETNGVMIMAETAEGTLAPISAELAGIGRIVADELGQPLVAVVVGDGVGSVAESIAELGVDRVLVADDPGLGELNAAAYLAVLEPLVRREAPEVLLLGHTLNTRELAARLAFRLETGLVTDCTGLRVEDGLVVLRKPVYGGSADGEFTVDRARPQMATVRPRAFEAATPQPGRRAETEQVQVELAGAVRTTLIETVKEETTSGPRLKDAKTVVSGGRGLGGPENWHYVDELAEILGGAVGATRAVTDAGWVPASHQVGLTGVTITPDLYITVGISGAVQHIAGCSGARTIVAINKDADANIFKHARFGIAGDYKQIVPAFTARVKELRQSG